MSSVKDEQTKGLNGTERSIQCAECQTPNSIDRRYCGKCGALLWQPCLKCGNKNAIDLCFCGHCGIDLVETFHKTEELFQHKLVHAKNLAKQNQYGEALSLLRSIDDRGDSRLQRYGAEARMRFDETSEAQKTKIQDRDIYEKRAQEKFDVQDFAAAKRILEEIPTGIRSENATKLAVEIDNCLTEIAELSSKIKAALQEKAYDGLLSATNRLLDLQPGNAKLMEISQKLEIYESKIASKKAARFVEQAKQLLAKSDYRGATEVLASINREQLQNELKSQVDQSREINWMRQQLEESNHATPSLLAILKRYQKLNPKDSDLPDIAARFQAAFRDKSDRRKAFPVFANGRFKSRVFDVPVFWWGDFRNLETEDSQVLKQNRGRFTVAYGLALHAIGVSDLKINLYKPTGGNSFLKRLGGRKSSEETWGIDIGNSGVKAVQLQSEDENVRLGQCFVVDHATNLESLGDRSQRTAICRETVERLIDAAEIERADAIVGLSSSQTLGRFFDIPKIKGKKMDDAIGYEAKVQIPLDIQEIEFDYHLWPLENNFQTVGLFAARKTDLQTIEELFADSTIRVSGIQTEAVALMTAAMVEVLSDQKEDESVAILDVGFGKSTLVVGGRHGFRFRNLAFCTQQWIRRLTSELKLERKAAVQVSRTIESAKWMHQISDALAPAFIDAVTEIQKSIFSYRNDGFDISKLIVTGGGATQFGFVDHLINGREDWDRETNRDALASGQTSK